MEKLFRITLCFILVALIDYSLFGQNFTELEQLKKEPIIENIVLSTDRSIYCQEELVFFSAHYSTNLELGDFVWSTVLYVELINADGKVLVQQKVPLNNKAASGTIKLPQNLLTGNYLLRAYTKWMRNFPVANYAYSLIKIVNQENSKLVSRASSNNIKNIVFSECSYSEDNTIKISTGKTIYQKREEVNVSVISSSKLSADQNYCISVNRKGVNHDFYLCKEKNNLVSGSLDTILFYPEIYGLSLSGKTQNTLGEPLEGEIINLSSLNGDAYFTGFKTNHLGFFNFNLPDLQGSHDYFITSINASPNTRIYLDEEYCTRSYTYIIPPFTLTEFEKKMANELSINKQLSAIFKQENIKRVAVDTNSQNLFSFYGEASRKITAKKYIDLPKFEDFLYEFVPEVDIKYKKKQTLIYLAELNNLNAYPILFLVDGIPIDNLSVFLNIKTNKIEYVELISEGYIVGDLKYSGIINIVTVKKDFAGIELPESSMFFKYSSYSNSNFSEELLMPKITKLPDRRNCLYWNPDFSIHPNSKNKFSFYTADSGGEYEIVLKTISKETGEQLVVKSSFTVE